MATVGKNENRSSTTELLPDVQKAVVQPDYTLNHYETGHVHSNFDMNGDALTGKAKGEFEVTGDPSNGEYLQLQDALGTTVRFTVDTSSTDVSGAIISFSGGAYRITVGVNGTTGERDEIVGRFRAAITAAQLPFYISATGAGSGVCRLRQQVAGPHGNRDITSTLSNVTVEDYGTGRTVFIGGANVTQPPFSKRFQLVRPVTNSGLAMSRNGHMTQG